MVINLLALVNSNSHVLLCIVCSAHGIRGHVRVKTFTREPQAIASYGSVTDGNNSFTLNVISVLKNDLVIAHIDGVDTRTQAEALRDRRLYVDSSRLPELKNDEFYHTDLIGLAVKLADETEFGVVTSILNFGSCDIVEILTPSEKKVLFPFTESIFPNIDTVKREILLVPPEIVGA